MFWKFYPTQTVGMTSSSGNAIFEVCETDMKKKHISLRGIYQVRIFIILITVEK